MVQCKQISENETRRPLLNSKMHESKNEVKTIYI